MNRHVNVICAATAAALLVGASTPSMGEQIWSVNGGTATFMLYHTPLEGRGLFIADAEVPASPMETFSTVTLNVDRSEDLRFEVSDRSVSGFIGRRLTISPGLEVVTSGGTQTVSTLLFFPEEPQDVNAAAVPMGLELHDIKTGFDWTKNEVRILSRHVTLSESLAKALGNAEYAGLSVGSVLIVVDVEWMSGDFPGAFDSPDAPPQPADPSDIGPDVTFCQLYDFRQFGRLGDVVGLSVATTSWNVGTEALDWYGSPATRHPFIIMNMFRLKEDRLEQIGQSWIKHGWCALDSTQCGGSCQPTGCSTLNVNCTDTYGSSLNASQNGLGPRDEVQPWSGDWSFGGSHFAQGSHSHNQIQHRIQVHDDDLDPDLNPGATYFVESFYVDWDDINAMNSAAWKPAPITNGGPGGTWWFGVSGPGVYPNIGFAIDAWGGAPQTMIAQEVPPVEFESPDGRVILAAKPTDLGGGQFHYEYALYNIDMDRKCGSFSVPLPQGVVISNVGFHAVKSHDEPLYNNDPWDVVITSDAITWSTETNPLRWGTMYNFRFDANARPASKIVSLGMYEPGDPAICTGETIGPSGPYILAGTDESFHAHSFSGYVDPRAESTDGENLNLGLVEFTLQFSEPVQNIGGGGLTEAAFVVRQTGADPPPNVDAISTVDNQEVTVVLDRIITLKEWTTIEADVQSMLGVLAEDAGDLGPGVIEEDRIDVGFLPTDVNQSADVTPFDLLAFRQIINGLFHHPAGIDEDYVDTDRNGVIEPFDLLTYRQLINGVSPPATRVWASETMNHPQP